MRFVIIAIFSMGWLNAAESSDVTPDQVRAIEVADGRVLIGKIEEQPGHRTIVTTVFKGRWMGAMRFHPADILKVREPTTAELEGLFPAGNVVNVKEDSGIDEGGHHDGDVAILSLQLEINELDDQLKDMEQKYRETKKGLEDQLALLKSRLGQLKNERAINFARTLNLDPVPVRMPEGISREIIYHSSHYTVSAHNINEALLTITFELKKDAVSGTVIFDNLNKIYHQQHAALIWEMSGKKPFSHWPDIFER